MRIITWKEIREEVKKANHCIAELIDSLEFNENIKFCKIDYPFGATVFNKGVLFVPNRNSKLVPSNDPTIPAQYREYLSYDSVPFGMILKNSISNSFETKDSFASLAVFYPGQLFGLMELFSSMHSLLEKKHWNLYAGTRATFSTTKFLDYKKYQVIKGKFGLKSLYPEHLRDHFFFFRELINHPYFSCSWSTSLLLFGRSIKNELIKKNMWSPLQTFFLKHAWEQSIGWHFDIVSRVIWYRITNLLRKGNFKNFGCQAEILRHIIRISLGYVPLFVSNDQGEITAPLDLLKEILIDECKIDSCPTIMVPGYLSKNGYRSGYYSITEPISIEGVEINSGKKSSMNMACSIQKGYRFIKEHILNNTAHIGSNILQNLFKDVQIKFFHSMSDKNNSLLLSSSMPNEDPSLVQLPKKYGKIKLPFDSSGSFFRGVIRVDTDEFFVKDFSRS